ncbi:alpha/beta hydrolase [Paraconexibacter antarcticus]|uniref:Alpha/beta hydrolase n=1 Tax=Paraconexibacter antarcticus TaxID=2949664 RepID=A0ABY5DSF0_9ACTN|nr:alpha/beta hydrolase [Paraconexibacter antarcticus]UTI64012.1 alpha/beta hydrolase [Paraconexibacter antarcticus]
MSVAAAVLLLLLGLTAALGLVNALWPRTTWWLIAPSWGAAFVTTELALHLVVLSAVAAGLLAALGGTTHAAGLTGLGLLVLTDLAAVPLILSARRTRLSTGSWFQDGDLEITDDASVPRYPRSHIAFPWRMFRHPGVRVVRGVEFAVVDGRPLKADFYLPVTAPAGPRPAVVQVHGGAWVLGSRQEQGIPLLNHLAACGFVGMNIDYRLSPWAQWPDHVVDVKRAIAYLRAHAAEYDVDPEFIAITGGSAGGHLAALAALTSDDRSLQPGFESADTSVAAAVPFYGVYDFLDEAGVHVPALHDIVLAPLVFRVRRQHAPERYRAASPRHRVHAGAPPFLVLHGSRDSLIPVADAHHFVEALRGVSKQPVLFGEMAGGQHAFDVIPSWRTVPVIEAIERFLTTTYEQRRRPAAPSLRDELAGALTD